MARIHTVRVWVETEVLAEQQWEAERLALEWANGLLHTPQGRMALTEAMRAACFGSRAAPEGDRKRG